MNTIIILEVPLYEWIIVTILGGLVLAHLTNSYFKKGKRIGEGNPRLPNDYDLLSEFECVDCGHGWAFLKLIKINDKIPVRGQIPDFMSGFIYGHNEPPFVFEKGEKYKVNKGSNNKWKFIAIK